MAEEHREGGERSQPGVLEPWSWPHPGAGVFLEVADTGHQQLGATAALTLPPTVGNTFPKGLAHLERGLDKFLDDKPLTRKSRAADPQSPAPVLLRHFPCFLI